MSPVPRIATTDPSATPSSASSAHGSTTTLGCPATPASDGGSDGSSLPVPITSASAGSTTPVSSATSSDDDAPTAKPVARARRCRSSAPVASPASATVAPRYRPQVIRFGNATSSTPAQRVKWSGSSGRALITIDGTLSRCHGSWVPNATPWPSAARGSTTSTATVSPHRRRTWSAASDPEAPPPTTTTRGRPITRTSSSSAGSGGSAWPGTLAEPRGAPRARRAPGRPYDPAMLLAVDVGNTNITLGLVEAGVLVATRRAGTHRATTVDELELALNGLLALDGRSLEGADAVVVASVVPSVTAMLEAVAGRRGLPILVATSGTVPLAVRVDRPGEVGPDRIVNALAAQRLYGCPAVVVDMGTATTYDCVGSDGAFVGGAIAPGLRLGLEALAIHTARLPRIELRSPDRAIGRDTVSAMQSGTVFGYQALVTGLLARIRRELAEQSDVPLDEVRAILTGGLATEPWARDVEGVAVIDPDLTLKGLAILYSEVAGGEPLVGAG